MFLSFKFLEFFNRFSFLWFDCPVKLRSFLWLDRPLWRKHWFYRWVEFAKDMALVPHLGTKTSSLMNSDLASPTTLPLVSSVANLVVIQPLEVMAFEVRWHIRLFRCLILWMRRRGKNMAFLAYGGKNILARRRNWFWTSLLSFFRLQRSVILTICVPTWIWAYTCSFFRTTLNCLKFIDTAFDRLMVSNSWAGILKFGTKSFNHFFFHAIDQIWPLSW